MNREKFLNAIGFTLLLACFAVALFQVFSRGAKEKAEGEILRFAHWQLEGGIREAFDVLAREYESLNPGVRIEQIAVPERTYPQWTKTQLIGDTATDIVQLGMGADDELLARFFVPISEYVERPNPYNRGTALADVSWRETTIDGMQAGFNYRPNLLEYYGASVSMFTVRIYYNASLWDRLLGDTAHPRTHDEFVALCERVGKLQTATGHQLLPIAGSKYNGPSLTNRLFASQTQRLNQSIDLLHTLRPANTDAAIAYLRGDWSIDHPAYTAGLEVTRQLGQFMQPGFVQLGREDATFYFLQGRALMIATGSWDSSSFRAQAEFDIGVFDIPLPSRDHPDYGQFVLGPAAEMEAGTGLTFGITRATPHFERALDFLHFLSSKPGNTIFSRVSGWLPSIVTVEPPEHVKPFLPRTHGYVDGFDLQVASLGANTNRVIASNLNRLVSRTGSVDDFRERMRQQLETGIRQDLERAQRNTLINLNRQDVILAGQSTLASAHHAAGPNRHANKVSELLEAQNQLEASFAWISHETARTAD